MPLPPSCEKAARATATRLRVLRGGSDAEMTRHTRDEAGGEGDSAVADKTASSQGPSAPQDSTSSLPLRASRGRLSVAAREGRGCQTPPPQTGKRRSTGSLGLSNSKALADPAAVAAETALDGASAEQRRASLPSLSKQKSSLLADSAASRRGGRGRRGVCAAEGRSGERGANKTAREFSFPLSCNPIEHVAATFPGGRAAFARFLRGRRDSLRDGDPADLCRGCRYSRFVAAAFSVALLAALLTLLLFPQGNSKEHSPPDLQFASESHAASTVKASSTLSKTAETEPPPRPENPSPLPAKLGPVFSGSNWQSGEAVDLLVPGMPLQKQLLPDGGWQPPPSVLFKGVEINLLKENSHGDGKGSAAVAFGASPALSGWLERIPKCLEEEGEEDASQPRAGEEGFRLSSAVSKGGVVVRLPRSLVLSTADASGVLKKNCVVPLSASPATSRVCSAQELLAVMILYELRLLRRVEQERLAKAQDLRKSCLLHSARLNAPFFSQEVWKAVPFVLPQHRGTQELLERTVAHVARGSLASLLGNVSTEDIQLALGLVAARSVSDRDGNAAVSALDELLSYHWSFQESALRNAHAALTPETDLQGLTWRASREMAVGDEAFVSYGPYSNAHLLFHFGRELPRNPWGPVFFFRQNVADTPVAAWPQDPSLLAPVRSSAQAKKALPPWLLKPTTIPEEEPCHFGKPGRCPPQPKEFSGEPPPERPVAVKGLTRLGLPGLVCNWRVFQVPAFGHGSFVLSEFGVVGGVEELVFRCVRQLLFGEIANPRERERRTVEFFQKGCQSHDLQLHEAERILAEALERATTALDEVAPEGGGDVLAARRELRRVHALIRAVKDARRFTRRCVEYFDSLTDAVGMPPRGAETRL